ncbi:hypothetical protein Y032_0003g1231 [Ancylostoma ceylanicum]|nr:hypothetical protein Y032_0003g1231 [Ancylostoma ceylanicum]
MGRQPVEQENIKVVNKFLQLIAKYLSSVSRFKVPDQKVFLEDSSRSTCYPGFHEDFSVPQMEHYPRKWRIVKGPSGSGAVGDAVVPLIDVDGGVGRVVSHRTQPTMGSRDDEYDYLFKAGVSSSIVSTESLIHDCLPLSVNSATSLVNPC